MTNTTATTTAMKSTIRGTTANFSLNPYTKSPLQPAGGFKHARFSLEK